MYTTSVAFFEALWEAGITHCFVNLGSDHPSLVEAAARAKQEKKDAFLTFITCPNEMVAMSMADGFARLTGKPQCVLVHVDVGTQGLGAAVHNASCGRAPVLIFAGLSPVTIEGEYRGSRTEFSHWVQDVPDQKQIVAQYCRYAAEVKVGRNIKQLVNRALSFARSDPQGPVYLYGAREILEEDIEPYQLDQSFWSPIGPAALPQSAIQRIAESLVDAKEPLLITGASGRNHRCPELLRTLADTVKGLRVLDAGGSDMCFPADHPGWLGLRFGVDPSVESADVIIVLDCDVPWINTQCRPRKDAQIYHIDVDPLKQQMPVYYIDALARFRADAETFLTQLLDHTSSCSGLQEKLAGAAYEQRMQSLRRNHTERLDRIAVLAKPSDDGQFGTAYLTSRLRHHCPEDTTWCIEAVTQTVLVADQLQLTVPGSWLNCGSGGLGWSGGAALGIKLASDFEGKPRFVCQIVGDGSFLFSVPSSVYWIAMRYKLPILTVVLNNRGWNAPRRSLLLVHPDGQGSKMPNDDLNIAFDPSPDYAGIAKAAAAGQLYAARAATADELERVLAEAVRHVMAGTPAVIDAHLDGSSALDGRATGKYRTVESSTLGSEGAFPV